MEEIMYKAFLIKYAEIAIKGKNRYLFEDALVSQMNQAAKFLAGKPAGFYDMSDVIKETIANR